MTHQQDTLAYYAEAGAFTDFGQYADHSQYLPDSVPELVEVVQNLGIYDLFARDFYGVTLSDDRMSHIHLRPVETMLEALFAVSDKALTETRTPNERIACRCHAFTKLIVSLLRAKGIPARARCGFGTYFGTGNYEDHWVCEYWNASDNRWVMIDAQLDATWREKLGITWNTLDMNNEQFLVAGKAWQLCRNETVEPNRFGIGFVEGMHGLWFVAGNLVRDVAALNKMEMLPWDVWGGAPASATTFTDEQLAFYDELATLTLSPDSNLEALQTRYQNDERLRVPEIIFNNLRQQTEPLIMPNTISL